MPPGGAVALVNDDVREVVLRIVAEEERRVAVCAIDAERLVGGDVHAGVLRVVPSSVFLVHLGGVRAEDALHRFEALGAQFVPVAQEERSLELARVGDPLQQVTRNECLARARGERQQRARLSALRGALCDLLQYDSDGGVLEISPLALAAHIARQERFGDGRFEREAHDRLVAGAKIVR